MNSNDSKRSQINSHDSQAIIDQIFSYDVFNQLDKDALVKTYDFSGAVFEINSAIRSQQGQQPQADNVISEIPPQGIVINNPGTYTLAGNLTWNPESTTCSAITITASKVVLDMGNFSLTATVEDNSQLINGITIQNNAPDVTIQNITIRNGTLANMCLYGILAENVSGLSIENISVDGLSFNNLDERNRTPAGIHIQQAADINIANCTVRNLNVTADGSAGIQIVNTSGGTVSNCQMSDFVNNDGSVQGYSYLLSSKITTSNCQSLDFQSHFNGNILTSGHTVLGFVPILCIELVYENCSATNMTGCCDDCHGMSVFLDALVEVNNFTANNVIDGVAESHSGAKATGLEVYGVFVSINNCSVTNITAIQPQDMQSAGFSAWGFGITFTGCTAADVSVTDENGNKNPALGYGTGFGWAPDPRQPFRDVGAYEVEYSGCSASNCQVGFDTWFHLGSTWTNVSYTNCDINILVEPGGSRTLSGDPCSECNPPITAVIKNIANGNTYPGS